MIPALGRHLLESTAFASAVALLPLFFMRNRGAAARHAVWLIAAAKFAVPAGVFWAVGTHVGSLLPTRRVWVAGPAVLSSFLLPPQRPAPIMDPPSGASILLTLVWLSGAGMMLSLWFIRLFACLDSTLPATATEMDSLARMQQRIRVGRTVTLRRSKRSVEPGMVGLWHTTITIPLGLSAELTRAEFEAILLHELAHAKRWDNLSGALVHALVCLFWFHPLLWWIERRVITERELACDEMVLRYGADREEYIAGILKVCRFYLSDAVAGVSAMMGSNLKRRMEVMMAYQLRKAISRPPKFMLGALASLMCMVPLAGGFLGASASNAQTKNNNKSTSSRVDPKAPVNCVYAGNYYLEGTVIQYENGSQRMCVDAHGESLWVRTDNTIRERSSNVVVLPPPPPPIICEPEPSSDEKFCVCKGHGVFSEGAGVDSANGVLGCFRGQWWRPAILAKEDHK